MNGNHEHDSRESELEFEEEDDIRREEGSEVDHKRVIALIDVNCFEVQVWVKEKRPDLVGKDVPIVVVNLDQIILAINYTARLLEPPIQRGRGPSHVEEITRRFPELVVIQTGTRHEKQDTFTPQVEGDKIFQVINRWQMTLPDRRLIEIERASKDEMYIDLTKLVRRRARASPSQGLRLPAKHVVDRMTSAEKTHPNSAYKGKPVVAMEGRERKISKDTLNYRVLEIYPRRVEPYHADEIRLVHGAVAVHRLMELIHRFTGYKVSAGVAHNKLLAKLGADRNKPEGITIMTEISFNRLSKKLNFQDLPGFGAKKGEDLRAKLSQMGYDVVTMHDVSILLTEDTLIDAFRAIGFKEPETDAINLMTWYQGKDDRDLEKNHFSRRMTTSTTFKGHHSVRTWPEFKERLMHLANDMEERIEYSINQWKRQPHSLSVKANMRERSEDNPPRIANQMSAKGFVSSDQIQSFVMNYIEQNELDKVFSEIEKIELTASGFKFCHL